MKLKGYLEKKEGEIIGIASTEREDRDGEVIKQSGWDLENFKKNPALLASHNYQEFPIGKATEIRVEDNKLLFKAVFSKATEKAREAYELVKEGILNTFSVGFIPKEYDSKDSNVIIKAELLEISLVAVPSNADAVVLAKGMKGDLVERLVKEWLIDDKLKKEVEAIEKKNKEAEMKKKEPIICPHCKKDINKATSEVAKGDQQISEKGELGRSKAELDEKLIKRATTHLQELCRNIKKGGEKK